MNKLISAALLLIGTSGLCSADIGKPVTISKRIDIYRQCFRNGTDCDEARSLLAPTATSGLPGMDMDSLVKQQKQFIDLCKAAQTDIRTLKSSDSLALHDFKLMECVQEFMGAQPSDLDTHQRAVGQAYRWESIAAYYYAIELDLGHISEEENTRFNEDGTAAASTLWDDAQTVNSQAAEIEQLKAQLAALQSADHQQCRNLQKAAILGGVNPPNC